MLVRIRDILDTASLEAVCETLADPALFEPGDSTAGPRARRVKANLQAKRDDPNVRGVTRMIEKALGENDVFRAAAQPKNMGRVLLSRYDAGMGYGQHIDAPIIEDLRTDLSFTLFLSEPDDYEGGELVIDTGGAEEVVKLPAGALILYPATYLHRVETVTAGVRLAAVGWLQSYIRAEAQRDMLFDLDRTIADLVQTGADDGALDNLTRIRANLFRMWADA